MVRIKSRKKKYVYTSSIYNLKNINISEFDEIIVCMRFKPKSIKFNGITYNQILSPSIWLLNTYKSGIMTFLIYRKLFIKEKQNDNAFKIEFKKLFIKIKKGYKILILCSCDDYTKCHRTIMCDMLHKIDKNIKQIEVGDL